MLIENSFGHGAITIHPLRRKIRSLWRKVSGRRIGRGLGFDWEKGYDVRDVIGPISIKNQGTNDSCGGQAGSYFLEIVRRLQKVQEGSISAKSIYAPIHYPGGGTTIAALQTQLSSYGANLEKDVPSTYANGTPLSEAAMIEESWQTDALTADAFSRAGYTPYDLDEDINVVARAIQTYGAAFMEIQGQNGHTPGWLSPTPQPPVPNNGNELFSHFMCLIGAKMMNGKKTIIALQSMGESVGERGIQYFSQDYFTSGFVLDCFTLIHDSQITPLPSNHSIFAEILRFFKRLWQK